MTIAEKLKESASLAAYEKQTFLEARGWQLNGQWWELRTGNQIHLAELDDAFAIEVAHCLGTFNAELFTPSYYRQ